MSGTSLRRRCWRRRSHAVDRVAATDAELAEIREQIKQMKEDYEARIRALEERLKAAETAGTAGAARRRQPPAPDASARLQRAACSPRSIPAISVVLQGNYQNLSQDPAQYGFNNIQLGEEVSPGPTRLRARRVGGHVLRQRRPPVRGQPHGLAGAGQLGRGRGSVRRGDRPAVRHRAEVRTLLLRHRIP